MTQTTLSTESVLQAARQASYTMATLTTEQKNTALHTFADLITQHQDTLLAANQIDLDAQTGQIPLASYQRLKLDTAKLAQLCQGLLDMVRLPDPVGKILSKTLLDDGLVLEKITVPLGVIAIIFESRPDVIPQILSLALKSGNAVVLKGGSEALNSNLAFMKLIDALNQACPFLPTGWAQLLETREAIQDVLNYPQYVDLVIPRGSNQLVQSVMAATSIPVLGHADGVCHLYVDAEADLAKAVPLAVDAKAQYPAACNALETLLVHRSIAPAFLPAFAQAAQAAGITLRGCPATQALIPEVEAVTDWHIEYGNLTLAVKVLDGLDASIAHINAYGSHHTDAILSQNPQTITTFFNAIDSACVFANASTRFADGFRFGLGAEVGISTAKTHARGPVGLEGLVIYQYRLQGDGHIVAPYTGADAKPFKHQAL